MKDRGGGSDAACIPVVPIGRACLETGARALCSDVMQEGTHVIGSSLGPPRPRSLRSGWAMVMMGIALIVAIGPAPAQAEPDRGRPQRIISLNPSLTAIVLRLGGEAKLVGVDDYSGRVVEAVGERPRVGGLFDPSLEAIVALRPDRVLVVAGVDQQSHATQLERLGIAVEIFQNERLSEVLGNIERLGRLLGREQAAAARIEAIRAMRAAVAEAARGHGRPGTLAVVDRSPLYLVGGETFLDEMMEAVGARNLARELGTGYPRASVEWLIRVGPELLLDMTPTVGTADSAAAFWSRWSSLPAVAADRVLTLEAARISLPGPDLDQAFRELAIAVHGESIEAEIEAALGRSLRSARSAEPPHATSGAQGP